MKVMNKEPGLSNKPVISELDLVINFCLLINLELQLEIF